MVLLLSSCALLRGRDPEHEIAVDLPTSQTEAVRRTIAAFRDQGYEVRESLTSGTTPTMVSHGPVRRLMRVFSGSLAPKY